MTIAVSIVDGPLPPAQPWAAPGAGAVLTFEGIVRPTEDGAAIVAIDYDSYRPMAQTMLEELAAAVLAAHGLEGISVEHAVGKVSVGEISFRLRLASEHRAEGLAAAADFISRMKEDVPLFKTPLEAGL
jgi:molybdopterin synthase catalytic subunit